jgi:DNA replication protein DnaC
MQERCETCGGTGIVETPLPWVTRCWDCVEHVETIARASGGIRTWRRYQNVDLAGFDWHRLPTPAATLLQEYADDLDLHLSEGWGLILTGGVGSGKTHCAVGLGVAALGMGFSTYATTLGTLLMEIRAGYQGLDSGSEQKLIHRVCTVELLILDDLGVEKPSEWARERLAYIVNQRYAAELATIVTTNLGLDDLEERWDSRVVSRLYGTSQAVGLTGVEDYRREQRKQRIGGNAA